MKNIVVKTALFLMLCSLMFSCSSTPSAPTPAHTATVPTQTPLPTQALPTATLTEIPIPTETALPSLMRATVDGGGHLVWIVDHYTESPLKTFDVSTIKQLDFTREVAWSPDGRNLVYATTKRGLYIYSLETEKLEAIKPSLDPRDGITNGRVDWSPDGQWIAFGRNRDRGYREPGASIYLIRPDGTEYHPIYTYTGIGASGAIVGSWTPDSKYLLFYVNKDNVTTLDDLYIVDVAGKHPQKLLSHRPPNVTPYIAVSPDGKTIYYYENGRPHMSPIDCYYDHSCTEIPSKPADMFPVTWYKDITPRWTGSYPTFYEKYGLP